MPVNPLLDQVAERMKSYPSGSQSDIPDPLVVVKLFDVVGAATW